MALSISPKLGPFFAWNKTNSSTGAIESLESVVGRTTNSSSKSAVTQHIPINTETTISTQDDYNHNANNNNNYNDDQYHHHHRRSSSSLIQSTTELSTFDADIPDVDLTQTATRTTNTVTITPSPNTVTHIIKPSDFFEYKEYKKNDENDIDSNSNNKNNNDDNNSFFNTRITPLLTPQLHDLLNADTINHIPANKLLVHNISNTKKLSASSNLSEEAEQVIFNELFHKIGAENEHEFLYQHNYAYYQKLSDLLQGELFKAEVINKSKLQQTQTQNKRKGKAKYAKKTDYQIPNYVAIKKIEKTLYKNKVSIEDVDGFCTCVDEDILKESKLLKQLTVSSQKAESKNIIHFVEFFESTEYFYLVFEYVDEWISLKQFVDEAHAYIKQNKLKLTEYIRMIRYIFWQISSTLHWLHTDIKCMYYIDCMYVLTKCSYFDDRLSLELVFGIYYIGQCLLSSSH